MRLITVLCRVQRVIKYLVSCVSTLAPDASFALIPSQLVAFLPRLRVLASGVVRVARVNLDVHAATYNSLITAAVARCANA